MFFHATSRWFGRERHFLHTFGSAPSFPRDRLILMGECVMSRITSRLSARRTLDLLFVHRLHGTATMGADKKSCSTRMRVFTLGEIIEYFFGNSLLFFTLWTIVVGDALRIPLLALFLFEKIEHLHSPYWGYPENNLSHKCQR